MKKKEKTQINNIIKKVWQVKNPISEDFIKQFPEVNPIILQLLSNREINTQSEMDEFLKSDYDHDLHNPFLFKDMEKACQRIITAKEKNENVVVYGDYDADGICSAALLINFFKDIGLNAQIYLPHRETEGYGLNMDAVDSFIEEKIDLLITVDCGTTNITEIDKATANNIDVIVVDHHHVPDSLPNTLAFLNCGNPKDNYPFAYLAAVGMAYKLVQGLIKYITKNKIDISITVGQEKWLLDLVAISTVTDCVPLIGENHTLVKYGLKVLNKTKRLGLLKLIEVAGLELGKIEAWHLGFVIGPRLNAAGRIDHASNAYLLLVADDENEALRIAQELQAANIKRQQLTEKFVKQAKTSVQEQINNNQKILITFDPEWGLGLVGLIAGRLVEAYNRPTLVITTSQDKIKGSGRSVPSFSIIEAVASQSKYLTRFGGHEQACGFTIKDKDALTQFSVGMQDQVKELSLKQLQPKLNIDIEVELANIDWQLLEQINNFSPFGQNNPTPRFLSKKLQIIGVEFIGKNNKHLRIMVGDENGLVRKTIGFGFGNRFSELKMGERVDMVYEVSVNEWNGNRELQLKIVDLTLNES